jgi:integrase
MLYKRPKSRYWWCRFTAPNGKEIRQSTKTADKRLATEYEDRLKADLWRVSKLGDRPRRTWEDAVVRWIDETATKTTQSDDVRHLRWADQFLGGRFLDEITRDLLVDLSTAKKATGVTNSTVNRMMEVVRAILHRANVEWEWIDRTPAIRMLSETKRRIRWLTREDADKLLLELPGHLKAMTRFALATGLREANVTGLEWSQVDLQRRIAWIHADQAKAGKPIGVPLNKDATVVLRQQQGRHAQRVFTYNGKPILKAGSTAWRKALDRAGIRKYMEKDRRIKNSLYPHHADDDYRFADFRWHDLRHTWASWHVQAGTPIHVLQELGGWSDIRMVQKYAHLAPEHLAEYADLLSSPKVVQSYSRTLSGTPGAGDKKSAAS